MSAVLGRIIRDAVNVPRPGGRRVDSTESVGNGSRELGIVGRADDVAPDGWIGHQSLDQGLLRDAGLVGWHEVEQVLSGESIEIDLAKGSAVVWHLPGASGSATIISLPDVPVYQVLTGAQARKRTYGCTIRIVHGATADPKTITLPGGMGEEPFSWSRDAGKIDTVICSYSEVLGRWFSYPAGKGH